MRRLFSFFLLSTVSFLSFFLFLSCSPRLGLWSYPVKIEEVLLNYSTPAFFVEVSGYPPFTFEISDNSRFLGSPLASLTSTQEGVCNLLTLPGAGSPLTLSPGAYYMRVKSEYGDWTVYSLKSGQPEILEVFDEAATPGDTSRPFLMSTAQDLIDLSNNDSRFNGGGTPLSRSYILTSDIDLTGVIWKPIGSAGSGFTGKFNGNGHIVFGMESIDVLSGKSGFFSLITGTSAEVKNLGVKWKTVECPSAFTVGGFTGDITNAAKVSNCFVEGEVIRGGSRTGGFVGYSGYGATIENCYANIRVEGNGNVGGFIGYESSSAGSISFAYSGGDVISLGSSGGRIGGFVGYVYSGSGNPISSVALTKRIEKAPGANGFLHFFGYTEQTSPIYNTYYNRDIFSQGGTENFLGTTTNSIPVNNNTMSPSTPPFNTWDFTDIWEWDSSVNRPVLRDFSR